MSLRSSVHSTKLHRRDEREVMVPVTSRSMRTRSFAVNTLKYFARRTLPCLLHRITDWICLSHAQQHSRRVLLVCLVG